MWAVALVYYGGALVALCIGGYLAERFLLRDRGLVEEQMLEDTCWEHGEFLCDRCFDVGSLVPYDREREL